MNHVWLNGLLLPANEARIDPSDRGLLLGDGLFETLLAVDGRLPLIDRHLARLSASAVALGIPLSWTPQAIAGACEGLLRAEGLAGELPGELAEDPAEAFPAPRLAALRITLTTGPGARGLLRPQESRPTLLITAAPQDPVPARPARLILASTRIAGDSPLRRHKTLSYMESVLARREAAAAGADEALLLNTEGRPVEASAANLFLLSEGKLWTPAIADGALPGITRGLVLEMAAEMGLEAVEGRIGLQDLAKTESVFLSSSLMGLRRVSRLAGLPGGVDLDWDGEPDGLLQLRRIYASRLGLEAI
jgi:branched-chain amino acid aminotransferase